MKCFYYARVLMSFALVIGCNGDVVSPPRPLLTKGSRLEIVLHPADQDPLKRGIFYFSGWSGRYYSWYWGTEAPDPDPWRKVRDYWVYPESPPPPPPGYYDPAGPAGRVPWMGWYDEDNQDVVNNQILAIHDAGYRFVSYQIGWSHDAWHKDPVWIHEDAPRDSSFMDHMVKRHLASPYRNMLKFAITWHDVMSSPYNNQPAYCATRYDLCYWHRQRTDNGWTLQTYQQDVRAMTRYWFSQWIAGNPDYYKHNGRPVIFFWAPENFLQPANEFGTTIRATTDLIRATAAEFGFAGGTSPFLVATSVPNDHLLSLGSWGFDALAPYAYSPGSNGFLEGTAGSGFSQIADIYSIRWNDDRNAAQQIGIKYFVPNLARHDGRPWGNLPAYWNPAAGQFKSHVQASMNFANANPTVTDRTLMTCCWNEWGEGNSMERMRRAPSQDRGGTIFSDEHRHTIIGGVNRLTRGNVDLISGTTVEGWAVDEDIPNQTVMVRATRPSSWPRTPGIPIAEVETLLYRGDVNSYLGGVNGNHGFRLELPRTCTQWSVTVWALDSSGGGLSQAIGQFSYGPNC